MGNRGKYDRLVTINSVTNTQDDAGGNVLTYTLFKKVYMSKKEVSGSEGMEQLRETATTRTVFKSAYYIDGLTQDHQLSYNGVNYDIQIIKELGRFEGQEITCISKF